MAAVTKDHFMLIGTFITLATLMIDIRYRNRVNARAAAKDIAAIREALRNK